ncbi:MAG TPA: hypothetical protein VHH15_01580 [Actinophytocola sp.]|nr:hypothetical protein [Actinophytocola sp.]
MPPYGPPARKKGGRRLVVVLVVAVVLAAGVAGGVWLWQGGGDSVTAGQADLPKNPDLRTTAFPDLDSLGFGGGPAELCPSVNKVMRERGYQRVSAGRDGSGISCMFITTGLSLLKDGSNDLSANITAWRGEAGDKYQGFLDKFTGQRDRQQQDPDYRVSKVEQFPVGDEGFIAHQESLRPDSERTTTTAFFRSGEDVMMIAVWGAVHHLSETGADQPNEPLTEEIAYGELTDILLSLNGEGTPGEPRISEPDLAENPALSGLTEPALPTEGTPEEVCDAFADAAEQIGTVPAGATVDHAGGAPRYGCSFDPPEEPEDWPEDYGEREISIRTVTYDPAEAFRASESMGRELQGLMRNTATDKTRPSPLYELPIGDIGYALYHVPGYGYLTAAYLVDGRTYVHIELNGWTRGDDGVVPLSEDALLADLTTLLNGVEG